MWKTGGDMATFAVDGVRINPHTDRVTHVRWALIDPKTHAWLSERRIADVDEVVRAMAAGNVVVSLFTLGGIPYLGPKLRSVAHVNGRDGIDTEIPNGSIEKSIDDLPRV
jgi:hypothetical protein